MITQIYSIATPEEALACIEAGADHIGIAAGYEGVLPSGISLEEGRKIFDVIGRRAVKVALTVDDNPEDIYRMITALRPDIVHLCGDNYHATEEFCKKAKELVPDIGIMQAVGVGTDPSAVETAKKYGFCDYLILDSVAPDIPGIGAAGITHDWNISAEIVRRCPARSFWRAG